jgi:hypothetical protein
MHAKPLQPFATHLMEAPGRRGHIRYPGLPRQHRSATRRFHGSRSHNMSTIRWIGVRLAILCGCLWLPGVLQSPQADPLVGHWELNVPRTHYGGGAEPRAKETLVCIAAGAGVQCTIQSRMADGRTVRGRFSAAYDGTPGLAEGIPEIDHVRLTKIDAFIVDATFTFQGRLALGYRAVRSVDRRSLTIISVEPASRAVLNSVVVYDQR